LSIETGLRRQTLAQSIERLSDCGLLNIRPLPRVPAVGTAGPVHMICQLSPVMTPPVFGHRLPVAGSAEERLVRERRETEHAHLVQSLGHSDGHLPSRTVAPEAGARDDVTAGAMHQPV
jgi:hypothetical protein